MHSQLSHLEVSQKTFATTNDMAPAPVATTFQDVYDPSHPDADWSGLVSRDKYTRKHERGHVSQHSTY